MTSNQYIVSMEVNALRIEEAKKEGKKEKTNISFASKEEEGDKENIKTEKQFKALNKMSKRKFDMKWSLKQYKEVGKKPRLEIKAHLPIP